jgi:predicted permease
MSILIVLQQIAPLFIIMFIGLFVGHLYKSNQVITQFLSWLSISVFLPASLIKSFSAPMTPQMLQEGSILILAGAVTLIFTFFLSFLIVRLLKLKIPSSNIVYFSLMFSNFGFVGVGIISSVYGDLGLFYMTMYVLVMRFAYNSFGTAVMQRGVNDKDRLTFRQIFLNPPIIALVVGLFIMTFQIRFPAPVKASIDSLAACLSPVGMLTVGMLTANFPLKAFFSNARVYVLVFLRLLGIPLLVTFVMWLIGFRGMMLTVSALTLALPAAANCCLLAERYNGDVMLGTQIVTITNTFSVITMPLVVAFAERLAS